MVQVNRMLGHMFPLMALSGLLLAGWGLIVTPDEMKVDTQALLGTPASLVSSSIDVAAN
jgi:hypothetical protein